MPEERTPHNRNTSWGHCMVSTRGDKARGFYALRKSCISRVAGLSTHHQLLVTSSRHHVVVSETIPGPSDGFKAQRCAWCPHHCCGMDLPSPRKSTPNAQAIFDSHGSEQRIGLDHNSARHVGPTGCCERFDPSHDPRVVGDLIVLP